MSVKRDLLVSWGSVLGEDVSVYQKRPIIFKRDLLVSKETY
jgi:hypothetical protein